MQLMKKWMAFSVLLALSGAAHAQATVQSHALPGGWEFGSNFELSSTFNDNFFYAQSNEESVNGLLFRPALILGKNYERLRAAVNLGGEFARYDLPGDFADYFDGYVGLEMDYEGGVRDRFNLRASARQGHDPYGTNRTMGTAVTAAQDLDEWREDQVRGTYRFGAREAKLNVELQAGHLVRDYTTNEPNTDFLDYDKSSLVQTLIFNYSPKTAFVLNLEQDFVKFDTTSAGRDATEYRARVGARWSPLPKTRADIQLGAYLRDQKDTTLRDRSDGTDWLGMVTYTPTTRTAVVVQMARDSQESYILGSSVIDNQKYGVELTQQLGRRVSMVAGARWVRSDFQDIARKDDVQSYNLMLSYRLLEFVDIFASGVHSERDSTNTALDYRQTSGMMLGIRVSP